MRRAPGRPGAGGFVFYGKIRACLTAKLTFIESWKNRRNGGEEVNSPGGGRTKALSGNAVAPSRKRREACVDGTQ